jgi:aqualysin 1
VPGTAAAVDPNDGPAPLVGAEHPRVIEDRYIVVLEQGTPPGRAAAALARARQRGARVDRAYSAALTGYSATLDASALAAVRADPDVAYVEADQVVSVTVDQSPATWGLDRSTSATCR